MYDGSPMLCSFFFNDTATTEIYTLSLHDALPIYLESGIVLCRVESWLTGCRLVSLPFSDHCQPIGEKRDLQILIAAIEEEMRSEEHTSELQSHLNLVCRLLLEKKKRKRY